MSEKLVTKGIVLRATATKEADYILNILTDSLGRGRVSDLVFVEDRGRDLLLQKAVRVQGEEELVDDRPLLVLLIIILHAAHIREKPRDVHRALIERRVQIADTVVVV